MMVSWTSSPGVFSKKTADQAADPVVSSLVHRSGSVVATLSAPYLTNETGSSTNRSDDSDSSDSSDGSENSDSSPSRSERAESIVSTASDPAFRGMNKPDLASLKIWSL